MHYALTVSIFVLAKCTAPMMPNFVRLPVSRRVVPNGTQCEGRCMCSSAAAQVASCTHPSAYVCRPGHRIAAYYIQLSYVPVLNSTKRVQLSRPGHSAARHAPGRQDLPVTATGALSRYNRSAICYRFRCSRSMRASSTVQCDHDTSTAVLKQAGSLNAPHSCG